MKHHPLPFLLLAACTFGFTTARAQQEPITPSRAVPVSPANTDPSKPPVADPTADPFVRDGKKTPPATPPEAIAPMNIYALLEYIEVPRDQWLTWSAANPIKGDATALRAEVQKWIAAGQAKPFELTCLPTKSGQRSVIESTVERRFPTDFQPAIPGQVPVAFDKRDAYFVFEWEPVIGPDLFVESNFALHLVSFCGEDLGTVAERKATQPGDGGQPRFVDQNTSQNITSVPSQPMLVQVTTPVDELGKARDVARLLVFYRTAPVDAKPQTAPSPKPAANNPKPADARNAKPGISGTFEVERIEVTLADLNLWFASQPLNAAAGGLRTAAHEWIRAGRGREIDRQPNPIRSGNRIALETVQEFRFPMEYSVEGMPTLPRIPGTFTSLPSTGVLQNPRISPFSYDTRNLGYKVEMEPVVGPDGKFIDLNIVCTDTRHCGNVVFHRAEIDGQLVPDIEQPVFGSMKVTTAITVANGEPALLAIHTPADDQGRPQPERKILTFVTVRN